MKILKLGLIALILCVIVIPPLSCAKNTATISEDQLVTVQRGDLTLDITASGNLAYANYQDLAFQISGTSTQEPLTVAEVLVEEGDSVEAGQVLVKADTVYLEQAVTTAEREVKTSEIALEKAATSYREISYPYSYKTLAFDVPYALESIIDAKRELNEALEALEIGLSSEQYWDMWKGLTQARDKLTEATQRLALGQGVDLFGTEILSIADFWTLRAAQLDMETAQVALDTANDNLAQAQEKLQEAVIVAPFAGFITIVNVSGGDEVQRGVVAVRLVDPTKFEAELMVNEMDIFQLKLGGDATVQIDAMPTLTLPAKVTFISPTATITSGVVNYKVKVEIESLEDFQLREGLTVTVSIIVEQRSDVLLVPNTAITSQGGKTYVQVMLLEGVTEEREIQTGISNWQYTEVTGGLSEGETIVVPEGTATTTPTTSPSDGPSGGMMIPGMGGPR